MELLSGATLAARLRRADARRGLPLGEALTIAADVAEALAFAHRHGVVHRDVKPSNIMLTDGGTKLLDFGIASLRGEATTDAATITQTLAGDVVGTLPYMAPEQLDGRSDERTDVFALGAVLYEMLTGARAFPGESTADVIGALAACQPTPVSAARTDLPAGVVRIVSRCLQRDPLRRWQSAADLEDELRWALEPRPSADEHPDRATVPSPGSPARVRRRVLPGAVVVLAMAAFGLGRWTTPTPPAAPSVAMERLALPRLAAYPQPVHRSPVLNVDEPVGRRVVGRRTGVPDGLSTATSRASHAREWFRAFGGRGIPRGVYRFETHEDADRWLWRMLTRQSR